MPGRVGTAVGGCGSMCLQSKNGLKTLCQRIGAPRTCACTWGCGHGLRAWDTRGLSPRPPAAGTGEGQRGQPRCRSGSRVTGHRPQRPRGQVRPPGPRPAQPSSSLDPGGEHRPISPPLAPLIAQLVSCQLHNNQQPTTNNQQPTTACVFCVLCSQHPTPRPGRCPTEAGASQRNCRRRRPRPGRAKEQASWWMVDAPARAPGRGDSPPNMAVPFPHSRCPKGKRFDQIEAK
jgi:hypothetical protein